MTARKSPARSASYHCSLGQVWRTRRTRQQCGRGECPTRCPGPPLNLPPPSIRSTLTLPLLLLSQHPSLPRRNRPRYESICKMVRTANRKFRSCPVSLSRSPNGSSRQIETTNGTIFLPPAHLHREMAGSSDCGHTEIDDGHAARATIEGASRYKCERSMDSSDEVSVFAREIVLE